ncbi:MAG: TrbC/VirB2 family protein [Betaproteobacteria bacterium]|nr:TrbC/VirB2 family protein [Betaproteobacteria bacterium]
MKQILTGRAAIRLFKAVPAAVLSFAIAPAAWASGTGMPWETPMTQIEDSLTGPVAKALGVFAIVMFGVMFAFSEHGSSLRKGMAILMGISIAFAAGSFGVTFFGFSGGAGF